MKETNEQNLSLCKYRQELKKKKNYKSVILKFTQKLKKTKTLEESMRTKSPRWNINNDMEIRIYKSNMNCRGKSTWRREWTAHHLRVVC